MTITVRRAGSDDLDAVLALTRQRRAELATWEPVYWNPSATADQLHPMFLGWVLTQEEPAVWLAVESGSAVGCAVVNRQRSHWFCDDFCVSDERWADVGAALLNTITDAPLVTCVPERDAAEQAWLRGRGAAPASTTFMLRVAGGADGAAPPSCPPFDGDLPAPPMHTFTGGVIDPAVEGGLRIADSRGVLIGSAGMMPPIYDPGGMTTIVDRIVGPDRAGLLKDALALAGARGDVGVLVVCAADDTELAAIASDLGATIPVRTWRLA